MFVLFLSFNGNTARFLMKHIQQSKAISFAMIKEMAFYTTVHADWNIEEKQQII